MLRWPGSIRCAHPLPVVSVIQALSPSLRKGFSSLYRGLNSRFDPERSSRARRVFEIDRGPSLVGARFKIKPAVHYFKFAGETVFIILSQTLLQNNLVKYLQGIIPNWDPSTLANGGAASLRNMGSGDKLSVLLDVYNDSIRSSWYLGLGLSRLIFLASFGMEWKSVKQEGAKAKAVPWCVQFV